MKQNKEEGIYKGRGCRGINNNAGFGKEDLTRCTNENLSPWPPEDQDFGAVRQKAKRKRRRTRHVETKPSSLSCQLIVNLTWDDLD